MDRRADRENEMECRWKALIYLNSLNARLNKVLKGNCLEGNGMMENYFIFKWKRYFKPLLETNCENSCIAAQLSL